MESGKAEESRLKRFMKTEWFWIVYLLLASFLVVLITLYVGCISAFIIPIVMFIIPYWLKEKRIRRLLINGVIIFVVSMLFVNVFLSTVYSTWTPSSELSGEHGTVKLSHGSVEPFNYGGNTETRFRFSVVYANTVSVSSSGVVVVLELYESIGANLEKSPMTGDTAGNVTLGWVFTLNTTLPEGIYSFGFNSTTNGGNVTSTPTALGPINAPWGRFFTLLLAPVAVTLLLPVSLYYIIVGMYWWMEKAKMMRPPPAKRPIEKQRAAEFECTNCGADVPADASRCPRCGAVFEDEEEPEKEKKGGEERDLATKKKASIIEKKEK